MLGRQGCVEGNREPIDLTATPKRRVSAPSRGVPGKEHSAAKACPGTLGLSKDVPVGFQSIRLLFTLDTDASQEQIATLLRLTERYCVVFQTLAHPPTLALGQKS